MENEGRHYVRTTQAWYASAMPERDWVEEVYFYGDDPFGEMAMRWYDLGDDEGESPRLEVFIQSAAALVSLTDVLTDLARVSKEKEDKQFTVEKFCQLLDRCGFIDKTPHKYEDSYPERKEQDNENGTSL